MFGDNPTGAPVAGPPADNGPSDTLSGVDALASPSATNDSSPAAGATYSPDSGFATAPSEPAASAQPEPTNDDVSASPAPASDDSGAASLPAPTDEDLLDLKQQALQQLSPLLGHLDQTAEEKFRTTMMMIQATDNQDLLKEAYETAQKIEDEKTKAQALLDVINEINYFNQNKQQN
jgi:hypothetical protein